MKIEKLDDVFVFVFVLLLLVVRLVFTERLEEGKNAFLIAFTKLVNVVTVRKYMLASKCLYPKIDWKV